MARLLRSAIPTLLLAVALWPTSAQAITYSFPLDSQQEVPAPILTGATPSGNATLDVNTITGDVTINATYTGLTSAAGAAHLHGLAPPGVPAGVLQGFTVSGGQSGTVTGSGVLDAAEIRGLLEGNTYINVHTAINIPGEIRGQVVDPNIRFFDITLDAMQEVPTPTLNGATPAGTAQVVVDITTGAIEISGTYDGMTSDVIAAHLHGLAGPGVPTGVIFPLTTSGGTAGTFSGSSTLSAQNLAGLLDGLTYLNVHTANNEPGEIRGQVVPEPGTLALTLLATLTVCLAGRRQAA